MLEARADTARSLGRRLVAGRLAAGLSQSDVARALVIPQSQIAKVELGIRHLLFVEGLRLAEPYSMSPSDLDPRPQALSVKPRRRRRPVAQLDPNRASGQAQAIR